MYLNQTTSIIILWLHKNQKISTNKRQKLDKTKFACVFYKFNRNWKSDVFAKTLLDFFGKTGFQLGFRLEIFNQKIYFI